MQLILMVKVFCLFLIGSLLQRNEVHNVLRIIGQLPILRKLAIK